MTEQTCSECANALKINGSHYGCKIFRDLSLPFCCSKITVSDETCSDYMDGTPGIIFINNLSLMYKDKVLGVS